MLNEDRRRANSRCFGRVGRRRVRAGSTGEPVPQVTPSCPLGHDRHHRHVCAHVLLHQQPKENHTSGNHCLGDDG